ncbi:MAG: hypothetical protein GY906_22560 [bacterium]|nr:hypothetical protein [bacterium]
MTRKEFVATLLGAPVAAATAAKVVEQESDPTPWYEQSYRPRWQPTGNEFDVHDELYGLHPDEQPLITALARDRTRSVKDVEISLPDGRTTYTQIFRNLGPTLAVVPEFSHPVAHDDSIADMIRKTKQSMNLAFLFGTAARKSTTVSRPYPQPSFVAPLRTTMGLAQLTEDRVWSCNGQLNRNNFIEFAEYAITCPDHRPPNKRRRLLITSTMLLQEFERWCGSKLDISSEIWTICHEPMLDDSDVLAFSVNLDDLDMLVLEGNGVSRRLKIFPMNVVCDGKQIIAEYGLGYNIAGQHAQLRLW